MLEKKDFFLNLLLFVNQDINPLNEYFNLRLLAFFSIFFLNEKL